MERSYGTLVRSPPSACVDDRGRHDARARRPAAASSSTRPATRCTTTASGTQRSRGFFTGDTFGLSYREFDTAARRLDHADDDAGAVPARGACAARSSACWRSIRSGCYVTHYGRGRRRAAARRALPRAARRDGRRSRRDARPAPDRHAALMRGLEAIHLKSLRAHGVTLGDERIRELLALDLELNAQGIAIWLDRTGRLNHEPRPLRFHRPGRRRHRRRQRHRRRLRAPVRRQRRGGRALGHRRRRGAVARRRARGAGARARASRCNVARRGRGRRRARGHASPPSAASTSWSTTPASFAPPTSSTSPRPTGTRSSASTSRARSSSARRSRARWRRRGGGAIVNMSSVNGVTAIPTHRQLQREQGRHQPADARDGAVARRPRHPRQRGRARERSRPSWRRRRCSAAPRPRRGS